MHGALRVAVLAALLGSASAQICCMAMPQCPSGYVSTLDKCQDGESKEECLTVHMCCKTVHCRAVTDFCANQGPACGDGLEKCKSGYTCTADPTCTTKDCKQCCVRDETKPPAPTPTPKCDDATEPLECKNENECYNVAESKCGPYPLVRCLQNPCNMVKCSSGYVCEDTYCGGCHARCVAQKTKPPAPTPAPTKCTPYTPPGICIAQEGWCWDHGKCQCVQSLATPCTKNPCDTEKCDPGYVCEPSYCGGCNHRCAIDETKPPAPTPAPKCDDATEPLECKIPGECYNVKECKCGQYPPVRCAENPCNLVDCKPGYVCEASYCGGCHARCIAEGLKTPVPVVEPKGCRLGCGSFVPVGWRGADEGKNSCNTCSCEADKTLACTEIACQGTSGCSCTLRCGTVVKDQWRGQDEGSNECNTCQCLNGGLSCTRKACKDKPCDTKPPAPTPAPICCMAMPQCPSGYVSTLDKCQDGESKEECLTVHMCCKTVHCRAVTDFCANQGPACGDGLEKCKSGYTCTADPTCTTKDCKQCCVRDETKPPAPTPTPKCDDATEPLECKNENECYNVKECKCGPYPLVRCLQNPCNMVKCSSGYVCEDTYCGGCHARCIAEGSKTPVPVVEPKGCRLGCGSFVPVGWRGADEGKNSCNTCSCEADKTLVCTKIACQGTSGCSCTLRCGTVVKDQWRGEDEGSNECNTCQCLNGGLSCTRKACKDKPCDTKPPAPTPAPICCMAMPQCPSGYVSTLDKCQDGESKEECLTVHMCCKTVHCRAVTDFCANQGPACADGLEKCKSGYTCTADPTCTTKDCKQCCVRDETKPPAPTPTPKCDDATEPLECKNENECYNVKECKCGPYPLVRCLQNPCNMVKCSSGYVCEDTYCGGCHARCIAEGSKTPVPVVEPKGCRLGCGSFVPVGWRGADEGKNSCNTCSCEADKTLVCTKIACQGTSGCSCTLRCGTVVKDQWRGEDEGSNECNTCQCLNGGLSCTRKACKDKPCDTKPPAPTPAPICCMAMPQCPSGYVSTLDKCQDGESKEECLTVHMCCKTVHCRAVTDFCANQGPACADGLEKCKSGYTCTADPTCTTKDCKQCCVRDETKPPAPTPTPKCDDATEPLECKNENECYNVKECKCGPYPLVRCLQNPCNMVKCSSGYVCEDTYCGGCHARCIADGSKTPVPVVEPKGCRLGCGSFVPVGWRGADEGKNSCNTCSCEADKTLACTEIACQGTSGCPCTLRCGTVVKDQWRGQDEGSNECNTCQCLNGGLSCTRKACKDKPCDTKPPAPTPAPTKCDRYTEPVECKNKGECYNANECKCGEYGTAMCLVDPCMTEKCDTGFTCVSSYCGGCNHRCVRDETKPPAPTPAPICCMAMPQCPSGYVSTLDKCQDGESKEECLTVHMCCKTVHCRAVTDFCANQGPACGDGLEKCKSGYTCTADPTCTTKDCKQCCVRDETKPPAPTPTPKCDDATEPLECKNENECYNVKECKCGPYPLVRCLQNPCNMVKCSSGYVCEDTYCGGCHARCIAEGSKTPVPVVEPKGCRLGCGSFVPVGWRGADEGKNSCNTCSCEADKTLVCTKIACQGTSGCSCTLRCGTVVKDQWRGQDEGSNECNTCQCLNGGLSCTRKACKDKPCDTKPPAPTPAPICCMAMPQCPSGYVSTLDKCQDGESKEECLTVHMCCKTVHCRAVTDFCANQGPACGDGLEKCKSGYTCTADPTCTTKDCKQCCVRDETKPPAPTPTPKCDDATEPLECKNENECYNVKECKCGPYPLVRCLQNPCNMVKCSSGYVCEDTYCGGCHARCIADGSKTPVPVVEPKGCRLGCGSFVPVGWRGADEGKNSCNTCSCEADKTLACTEIACQGTSGCPCTLRCGTVVKDQWRGQDEGSNECNTCQCLNGGLSCTRKACKDKPCDTKPPAPTPAPTKCDRYTEPVECKNKGECYNANECKCGEYGTAMCLVDPCMTEKCDTGFTCVSSYCGGCNHRCVRDETKPPAPTPAPICCMAMPQCPSGYVSTLDKCQDGESKEECLTVHMCCKTVHCRAVTDFCANQGPACGDGLEKCKSGYTCTADPTCTTKDCKQCCVRDETKPPAPTPTPKCDDATEPLECKNENECYNVAECKCGPYPLVRCLQNPCNMVKCSSGYVCEDTYCGGCHARCVAQKTKPPAPTSAPTPVPETLPFCALQGPTCGRFSPRCKRGYACLADPTCDRETEKCDRCCCALPQCKPGYRLRRRRSECRDKATERGLCYEVKNSCGSFVCQKPRRWN